MPATVDLGLLEPFKVLMDLPEGTRMVIALGPRGGGKSRNIGTYLAAQVTLRYKEVAIMRDEKTQINQSILKVVLKAFDRINVTGLLDGHFQKLSNGIKAIGKGNKDGKSLTDNDGVVLYAQGFRASSNEKTANLKGFDDIDIAFIEEAEDIRDKSKVNKVKNGIRTEGSYLMLAMNVPDKGHWVIETYFNCLPVTEKDCPELANIDPKLLDGYFKLEPKENLKGVQIIWADYKDNPYLPKTNVEEYESYANPDHQDYDPHEYLTQIKGFTSSGRKGQIFKNYKTITLEEFNNVDATEVIGQDFGTSSPAAMVLVKTVKNKLYIHELSYKGMDVKEIAFKYCELGIDGKQLIIVDSAEPKTYQKLYYGLGEYGDMSDEEKSLYPQAWKGFNAELATKGPGSIESGISTLKSMEIYITEGSANVLKEFSMYCYATDKNGNSLDKPIDDWNHAIDAVRYVVAEKGILF